ncbi:hypothetical protein FXV83_13290 [Bradyrhizobium hipponense]|uniref:Uncharacterized protein n=1 Tax=Bradyrhizobium hipponense TaxID=2605638 RepID=A0A5S4YNV4_9BRAD|nr:hypothetical protein [Bradyrhizobium hipponense]TYO66040.1 hypothetical protein FXV83_13290 [Bradyrhizobium hipponense]
MTQAEIEGELHTLRLELKTIIDRDQSRETEWRRLSLIARVLSVLYSVTAGGLICTSVFLVADSASSVFRNQLIMLGIVFMFLSTPLMLLGQAIYTRKTRGGSTLAG